MNALPLEQRPVHDQIQRVHYLDVSAGAAYSITDSFDVFGSFSRLAHRPERSCIEPRDHRRRELELLAQAKNADTITASAAAGAPQRVAAKREGSLVRCVCQKSAS